MSVHITYFVHGTTTDNEEGISSGWKDVDLSELGREQSKKLRDLTRGQNFDVIYCSDLVRAADSAVITWGDTHIPIIQDGRLRECNYGDLNGASSDIVEPLQEKDFDRPFPNGESYEDVKKRIASFLAHLKKNDDGKHIAIVAHKAPQLCLDVLLKNKTFEEALRNDWRKKKEWKPGWEYTLE